MPSCSGGWRHCLRSPCRQLRWMATRTACCPRATEAPARPKFTGRRIHRVVPGAGHDVPQEAPEAFAAAVMELIRRAPRVEFAAWQAVAKTVILACASPPRRDRKTFTGAEFSWRARHVVARGLADMRRADRADRAGLRPRISPAVRSPGSCPSRRAASPTRHRASSPRKWRGRSGHRW